jgi:2-oxoglutarate ferredoxin oxidoreductase subunit delta
MPLVEIDRNRCKGCELCVLACPQSVLSMSRKINVRGYFPAEVAEPFRCIGCTMCALTCPDVAIEIRVHGAQYAFFES